MVEESDDDEDDDLEIIESDDDEEEDESEESELVELIGGDMESADCCIAWLRSIGYGKYADKLKVQWEEDEMDKKTLKLLNERDLV